MKKIYTLLLLLGFSVAGILAQNASISGTVFYKHNPQSSLYPHPLDSVSLYLVQNGTIIRTAAADANGNYNFQNLDPGTYTIQCTCSKRIGGQGSSDALSVLRHFVGIQQLTGLNYKAALVMGNSYCNSSDALAIVKFFVGAIPGFVGGTWVFDEITLSITGQEALTQTIFGLCFGDVNGSFYPF